MLADVPALTEKLIHATAPLLGELRSGHYLAVLTDLDLQQVDSAADSWWHRRLALRRNRHQDADTDDAPRWPGTAHFQLRAPIPGPHPTFGVVLPTQAVNAATASTLARHARAIDAGAAPAALLLTWVEDRYVEAEDPERFLISMVLDGHHKLLAYAQRERPARALMLCRLEDSWGPPDDRTRWLDETTRHLQIT